LLLRIPPLRLGMSTYVLHCVQCCRQRSYAVLLHTWCTHASIVYRVHALFCYAVCTAADVSHAMRVYAYAQYCIR